MQRRFTEMLFRAKSRFCPAVTGLDRVPVYRIGSLAGLPNLAASLPPAYLSAPRFVFVVVRRRQGVGGGLGVYLWAGPIY